MTLQSFTVVVETQLHPWNIERQGMTVLSGPSFFWRNSVDLDFFFVCSTRGKWNFPCQPCELGDKRRGEDGIVGVVRRVFLTRLIGEVEGWRRDENSGVIEWNGLWDYLTIIPFFSASLFFYFFFFFVFFLDIEFMFRSLIEIGFRREKGGVWGRNFFYRILLYFCLFCAWKVEEILIKKF